ncbi:MAG: hypothetical protein ABSC32_13800 [Steroidobacteraceae bacterium]|jgi:hypothetical protein
MAIMAGAAIVVTLAASSAPAENLLLNSSFRLATNQATPDDWDLHHAAAIEFKNLHTQYNLMDDAQGPIYGARVLRITNSAEGFPYLYLLSRQRDSKLPAGTYVFSVYAKADRPGDVLQLAPTLDHMELKVERTVTGEWQRYSAEFRIDDPDKIRLSPLLVLPSYGTYWISAPQLESGGRMTPYAPAAEDTGLGAQTAAQRAATADTLAAIAQAVAAAPARGLSATFEFNAYTDESRARLKISGAPDSGFDGAVACARPASPGDEPASFSAPVALKRGQVGYLDIPIAGVPPGEYLCSISGAGQSASAKLIRLAPAPLTARINQFRNTLEINRSGYQIRGIMVGGYVPRDWYFSDLVDHGINTLIFYPGMDAKGNPNAVDLDAAIRLAEKHGVKLIVGPPVMGQKNGLWRPMLERYADLVAKYRNSPAIIGWFVVDEPQARTLRKDDLVNIYDALKAVDPHRLVFINWGSDDVPGTVGVEPHGTLAATDLYSIDYYPFANDKTSLENYTLRTIRALRTGMMAGRPGHSWLQLYGYLDVSREPTGDELNYMAYVDLLFGGNYSYWQIKSNAKPTWDRLGETNREMRQLTETLTLNPDATQVQPPTLRGRYLYSAWKTKESEYLIVLHVSNQIEPFTLDLKSLFGPEVSTARTLFGDASVDLAGSTLKDSFAPYAARVYTIK